MPRLFFILLLLSSLASRTIRADSVPEMTSPETDLSHLAQPGHHVVWIQVDNFERQFFFVTPKGYQPGESLPLLFCFHGGGGHGEQAAETYGWARKADTEKFFAVFPDGLPRQPGDEASFLFNPRLWRNERSNVPTMGVDDVHFFATLLDQLEAALPVDRRRIYVTGFSMGAGMTFTLGAHFSDRIAAIAPVSSNMFIQVPALARPLPVYYLVGKADPVVPFAGGKSLLKQGGIEPPVQTSVDTWVKLDGLSPEPRVVSDQNGVRVVRYGPGPSGAEILFTTVEGNGHHWPGSIEPLPHSLCGPTCDPFQATDRIWDFFKEHPLLAPGKT
jgi:polyhydroxybutyrate depolymerase